jgi:hypothetical protein
MYLDHVLDQRGINVPVGYRAKAEVQLCATAAATSTLVAPSDFALRLSDGEVLTGGADPNFEQPLKPTRLKPRDCLTGYVSWQASGDQFVARSITDAARRVTWTISCPPVPEPCVDPAPAGNVSKPTVPASPTSATP